MKVYQCPRCATSMEADETAKPQTAAQKANELAVKQTKTLREIAEKRCHGEKCDCCGRRYKTVYRVPNWVWRVICPDPDNLGLYTEHQFGGLLCMDCAFDRAKKKNIHLYFTASVGDWDENLPG